MKLDKNLIASKITKKIVMQFVILIKLTTLIKALI